ncbi:EamA family transporter [Nonomuraea sp. NPDC002799]
MTRVGAGGIVRVAALAMLWGPGFLWIKISLRGLSPTQVTLARLVLGAIVLVVVVHVQRQRLARGRYLWVHLAGAALFANAAPYLLFALGEANRLVISRRHHQLHYAPVDHGSCVHLEIRPEPECPSASRASDGLRRSFPDLFALVLWESDPVLGWPGLPWRFFLVRDQLPVHGSLPCQPGTAAPGSLSQPVDRSIGPLWVLALLAASVLKLSGAHWAGRAG